MLYVDCYSKGAKILLFCQQVWHVRCNAVSSSARTKLKFEIYIENKYNIYTVSCFVHINCESADLSVFLWADKSVLSKLNTNNLQLSLVGVHVCTVYVGMTTLEHVLSVSSKQKRRNGCLEEFIKLSAISVHFIDASLNRILHIFSHHTAAQQYNCLKEKVLKDRVSHYNRVPTTRSQSPGKHYPTELGDAAQNAPWHKCRQQPNNIPSASRWGNTAWESKRNEHSKKRVRPRGEQTGNRSMAFAQSFDPSL